MKPAGKVVLLLVLIAVLGYIIVQRQRRAEALGVARSAALSYRVAYCYEGKLFVGLREIEYDRAMAHADAVGVDYAELDRIRQGVLNDIYACTNANISQQVAAAGRAEQQKRKAREAAAARAAAEPKAIREAERAVGDAIEASRSVRVVFTDGRCDVEESDPAWVVWLEKNKVAQRQLNDPDLPRHEIGRLRGEIADALAVWEEELSRCRRRAILGAKDE